MINPWLILALALMWGASVVGASHKWASLKVAEARTEYLEEKNAALSAANGAIKALTDAARATERAHVERLAAVGTNYAKGMRDAEAQRKRDVAAARDGALKLRVPASVCGGGEGGKTSPAPGGSHDSSGIELPGEITANLLDLAHDADQLADQLRACQQVILSDREPP